MAALAFAAVTLRLYLPLAAVAGFSFAEAYPLVAWLCWLPNLVIAERALRRSAPRPQAQPQAAAVTV